MFFIYNLLIILLSIIFLPIIILAFIIVPKFRTGFFQKIGFYNINLDKNKPTILFHAVSVGEVNAIENLVKITADNKLADYNIVLSTVTKTGHDVAVKKLKDFTSDIIYFPYDFRVSILSLLKKLNPQKIIIAETEIWPNFVYVTSKKNIELYIINGRISPHSYRGYKKLKFFFSKILSKYNMIAMQSEIDKDRIIDIGAPKDKVVVMGNLKFDIEKTLSENEIEDLKNQFGIFDDNLIIASSTHSGEDEIFLETFLNLKNNYPDLKLLIAPRHPQRYSYVENLLKKTGLNYGKRSNKDTFIKNDIIMLDTMGELSKIYSICKFTFIGGSFSNTGGHNPLEATIWEKPVLSGPSVFNFKDIYRILSEHNACFIANSKDELYNFSLKLLKDRSFYLDLKSNCKKVFDENKGAIDFIINKIKC